MKTFRIAAAAFMVLLGAMLIVAWSLTGSAVRAIDSGDAAHQLTNKLLADPEVSDLVADRVQAELADQVAQLERPAVSLLVTVFQDQIHDAIVSVLESDFVTGAVSQGVDRVENRITAELTDPHREKAPFAVEINVSDRINTRLDSVPVVGPLLPTVTVPTINKILVDADTFEQVRTVYKLLKFASVWFFWMGLALLIGGFFVAPRSRWYWWQAAAGVAVLGLAVAFTIGKLAPAQIARAMPGGPDGGAGTFVSEFVHDNAIQPLTETLLTAGTVALILSLVFVVLARLAPHGREFWIGRRQAGPSPDEASAETA